MRKRIKTATSSIVVLSVLRSILDDLWKRCSKSLMLLVLLVAARCVFQSFLLESFIANGLHFINFHLSEEDLTIK